MIDLRVDDLDAMLAELQAKRVEPLGRQDDEYGKFAWIVGADRVKIALWEPAGLSPV